MVKAWAEALTQMKSALDLLDSSSAPADVGAHLDLAICRLEDLVTPSCFATGRNVGRGGRRAESSGLASDHS